MFLLAVYFIIIIICECNGRFCKNKIPLEIGKWSHNLKHLDSVVIENGPVSMREGQVYVYENFFPNYIIKYVHVDNVAIKSCGANAEIKKGGVDSSSVLIVLHADTNEEIRSVIDIWGTKSRIVIETVAAPQDSNKSMKSLYLLKELRAINHNIGFKNI
ncbi:uncharacterized protein [Battus philenor]|uniref:uncharacterized protein n=1 Tax=Battus philenor TaxID=42288 RepID=UPI0035CF031D